jgi:2-amino-4-hydroxy-6-hydroxymethyldihydropteridine diphosphokinase
MRVVLLTGSNAPSRESILELAAELLEQSVGPILCRSRIYASQAWGFSSDEPFANQALVLDTELKPLEVLDAVLAVEQQVGRNRAQEQAQKQITGERYASRVVDVDIMFCDDEIISTPRLKVPHPLLHEREFALEPLCEIMGHYRHPVLRCSLQDIYLELKEKQSTGNE